MLFGLVLLASVVARGELSPPEAAAAAPQLPAIRLSKEAGSEARAAFEVVGLDPAILAQLSRGEMAPAEWIALFAVYVENAAPAGKADRPAVLGSYRVKDNVLRFEPRFPLQAGLRYRAVFDPSGLPGGQGKPVAAEFALPRPPSEATTVVRHVYPSASVLPENQLKFYLHFSAPMSRGEAYPHIRLLDASGKAIDLPFLELDEELWDPTGKRFTLLFDPGRIKRGLRPREEVGPAVEEGKSYTLVIDRRWADTQGNPLKESFRKRFRAGPPEDRPVDPKTWKIEAPAADGHKPLRVSFPRPLDHALVQRVLWVTGPDGGRLEGTVAVTDEETRWHFTPKRPWRAGAYQLDVETTLEDLAGNRIGRPFELDVFRKIDRELKADKVHVPFRIAR
jgi:hypothetical protein